MSVVPEDLKKKKLPVYADPLAWALSPEGRATRSGQAGQQAMQMYAVPPQFQPQLQPQPKTPSPPTGSVTTPPSPGQLRIYENQALGQASPQPQGDATQEDLGAMADYQGVDLSGALAALQGAYSGFQMPTSILDSLMSKLGEAPALPTRDVNDLANKQIELKYGGQEDALRNAMRLLEGQINQQTNAQQLYGQKADTMLASIFSALQDELAAGQNRTAGYYDQAAGQTGSSYDQAIEALRGVTDQSLQGIMESAKGLGIEQGLGGAQSPLAQVFARYAPRQEENINMRANSAAALNTGRANQLAWHEGQRTAAGRQGATARADVQTAVQQALADIGLEGARNQNSLLQQMTTLQKQRPIDLALAIDALNNQQYEMQRGARSDRLEEMDVLGGLDVQNQQNFLTAQGQKLGLGRDLADMLSREATTNAEIQAQLQANQPTQLELEKMMEDILGSRATRTYREAQTQNLLNPPHKQGTTYQEILNQFLDTSQSGLWGSGGAGDKFRGALNELIQAGMLAAEDEGQDPFNLASSLVDLGKIPASGVAPEVNLKSLNKQGLKRALEYYFRGR